MIPENDNCWCHKDLAFDQYPGFKRRDHDAECVHADDEDVGQDTEQPRRGTLKSVYLELGKTHGGVWTLLIHNELLLSPEGHAYPEVVAALADLLRRSAAAWTEMERVLVTPIEEGLAARERGATIPLSDLARESQCPELAEEQRLNDLADDGGKREPILVWLDHTRKHGCKG